MASSAKQTFQSKNRTKPNARTISSHNSESSHHTIHNSGDIAAFPIPRNDFKDLQREVSCGNDSSRMNSNFFQVRKSKAVSEEVFLPYLAQDEVGIDVAETQEVVDQLNKEIRSLLSLKFREFWQQVTSSRSLREFLDSYLHFRRRWYDLPPCKATGAVDNIIVGDGDLSRRVFMVLYRMASHQEPGVLNSESLSFEEHSSLLRKHKLLDLTKLLDISALYSHDNPQLTRKLVSNAIKAQPDFQYQIGEMVPHIVKTMRTMHHRCSSIVEVITSLSSKEVTANEKLYQELFEVVDYLHDVTVTLDAFIQAYPPAAVFLTSASSTEVLEGTLLSSMAAVHDSFLPILRDCLSALTQSGGINNQSPFSFSSKTGKVLFPAEVHLKRLQLRLVKFSWNLLWFSFLGGQNGDENSNITIEDPAEKGNQLAQAIVSLAAGGSNGAELQSLELSSLSSPDGSLIRVIQGRYHLCEEISGLRLKGTISLDDIQYDYLLSLVTNRNITYAEKGIPTVSGLNIEDQAHKDEQAVIHQSQISQVKDLFPEYGDGYIAACLEVYDSNPEMVIQKILEGTLHSDLLSLDTKLEKKTSSVAAMPDKRDKGKGKAFEEKPSLSTESKSGVQAKHESSLIAVTSHGQSQSIESNLNMVGRFFRRERGDGNAIELLDKKDVNASNLTAALASRLQYEDEYDDSFDDLGMHLADAGAEETETLADLVLGNSLRSYNNNDESTWQTKPNTLKGRGLFARPQSNEMLGGSSTQKFSQKITQGSTKFSSRGGMEWNDPFSDNSSKSIGSGLEQSGRDKFKDKAKQQKTPRFYIKDGKNYSYKVAGAVAAVSSVEEAEAVQREEGEMIYGLGAGGNVPQKKPEISASKKDSDSYVYNAHPEQGGDIQGSVSMRSWRGYGRGSESRGGHAQRDQHNHHRKDRALKKHFSGLGGY